MKLLVSLALLLALFATLAAGQTPELIQMPLAELQAKVDAGDVPAMIQLGLRHNLGIGMPENLKKCRELMEKAAAAGSDTAIGLCASKGWGRAKDEKLAFEKYTQASASGDLTAIRNLARCYQDGLGCAKDQAKAFELFQKAAASKDPAALYFLGLAYRNGIGTEKDPVKAVELWEEAATLCSTPLLDLADCYEKGIGCLKDMGRAVELLTQAADAQNPVAARELGGRYWSGNGVDKDLNKAHELYQKAGELGDGKALTWLGNDYFEGNGVDKSFTKAEELWLRAAELDYPGALVILGLNYEQGDGVTKDVAKANEYYLKAGELGDGVGYNSLGTNYANGIGVTQDVAKANECYLKAGELGDGNGYSNLGYNYSTGNGVTKDVAKANEFYRKGAELGSAYSMHNLGVNLRDGIGIAKDLHQAVEWLQKSADAGNEWGLWNLGKCYSSGRGVKRDMAKAVELFTQASEKNHAGATFDLGSCYENGLGVKKDKTKARELYEKAASLGNADAQQRLKELGPVSKNSGKSADADGNKGTKGKASNSLQPERASGVPVAADALIREAREALDEQSDFEAALKKAQEGIAQLDETNEAHIAQWAHAHATIAGALVELAQVAPASQRKALCNNAVDQVLRGAFVSKPPLAEKLKEDWPDLMARLDEESIRAYTSLSLDDGVSQAETAVAWKIIEQNAESTLGMAKKLLTKVRVQMAFAEAGFALGGKLQQRPILAKALQQASGALKLARESGDEDYIARAEVVHAMALMVITLADGGGGAFDPDRIAAKDEIVRAAVTLKDRKPQARFTARAWQWRDAIVSHGDKALTRMLLGAVGATLFSPPSSSTTEWNDRLRTMSGANSVARSSGSALPYPGIP